MTRLFGTNGIRWKPDEIDDPRFAVNVGMAIGGFFGPGSQICMGRDARTTGPAIQAAVVSGIMSSGCSVVDLGVVTTPTVQLAVKQLEMAGGVVISASHNPPEFNGVKCIAPDGTELARAGEERIEALFASGVGFANWDKIGNYHSYHRAARNHLEHVLSLVRPDAAWRQLKVVVDGANGPGGDLTPRILTRMGCRVVTINSQLDGIFPGRDPEPIKANLGGLMEAVRDSGADLGIAHDGDADRAMFIDENGTYINGNKSLAAFAEYLLADRSGKVVVPVNTSRRVTETIERLGGEIVETAIGSPLIARRMMDEGAVFGGEGNGGVIFPENMYCRDGMMSAAMMVKMLATGPPLSELVASQPEYALTRSKIDCPNDMKQKVIDELRSRIDSKTVDLDGLKIVEDEWWILLRPSGTEPIFRVTAEARNMELALAKLDEYKKIVDDVISSL